MNPTDHAMKEISKCAQNASKRLAECKSIEEIESMDKVPQKRSPHIEKLTKAGVLDTQEAGPATNGTFDGPVFPNPNKTREQMIEELEDHYSNTLDRWGDDEIDREYEDKLGL